MESGCHAGKVNTEKRFGPVFMESSVKAPYETDVQIIEHSPNDDNRTLHKHDNHNPASQPFSERESPKRHQASATQNACK